MCIYLAPTTNYTSQRGPIVIVSHRPAPVFRLLGLDTERISVPFSSKGVNHMAYLAHVVTVVWCALLFVQQLCRRFQTEQTFRLSATVPRPTEAVPLISRRAVRRRHYRQRINLRKLPGRQWESCPQTLRTVATDNDKDERLYRIGHRGL